jgi:hypothetical protein
MRRPWSVNRVRGGARGHSPVYWALGLHAAPNVCHGMRFVSILRNPHTKLETRFAGSMCPKENICYGNPVGAPCPKAVAQAPIFLRPGV